MIAAAVVVVLLPLSVSSCLRPLTLGSPEDRGNGRTVVRIPRHEKTPPGRPRTVRFFLLTLVLVLFYIGWQRPSPGAVVQWAVARVALALTGDPAAVEGYADRLQPATMLLAVSFILGTAVSIRAGAGPARRLVVAAHALLYLLMTVLVQAVMIAVGVWTGWPVGPYAIEATLANVLVGGLVVTRMTFSTFILPRSTVVPRRRPRWVWDSILTILALVVVLVLLALAYAALSGGIGGDTARIAIPMYASGILFVLLFVPLMGFHLLNRPQPSGTYHPPVDVIVPAYDEAENLARLIRSIDVAAGRYPGPVRLIISNDGSYDATQEIAERECARLLHAHGDVLTDRNGGQALALNRALAISDAPICVRVDADCVLGEDALARAVPWFEDPLIGTVGAAMMPRTDTVTWFHRLRALETLFQFRMVRVSQGVVDGIMVIPGTFTAFRREPVIEAGGYPVGMNGEDADLTLQLGRLGYRAVVDPRVVSFEDVPRSVGEFVEQRTRWARAGVHVFARHNPLMIGSAGPRIWFWTVRRTFAWFTVQAGLVAPVYIVALALTHPTYRRTVLIIAVLYLLSGALSTVISIPLAIRHRQWRSLLWAPTWSGYAFLRRLAALEAMLSLPTRAIGRPAMPPPDPVAATAAPEGRIQARA